MAFAPFGNNPFVNKLRDKIVDTGRGLVDGFSRPVAQSKKSSPRSKGRSSWELSDATVKPATQLIREATSNNRSWGPLSWLPGALSLAGGALNVGDQIMAHQFRNLGPARKALFEPQLPDGSDPIRQHGLWGNIAVGLQGVDDAGAAYTELTKRPDYKAASDLVLDREMRGDGSSWVNDQYRQERQPLSKRITHPGFSDMRDAKMLLTESPEDRRRRQLAQQGSDERNWGERFLQSIPGVGPIFQAPSIGETVSDAGFGPDASMFADIGLSPQNIIEGGVALSGKAAKRLNKVAKASKSATARNLGRDLRFNPDSVKQALYDAAVDVAPVPSSWKTASRERLNAPIEWSPEEAARIAGEAVAPTAPPSPRTRKGRGNRPKPEPWTFDRAFNEFQDSWNAADQGRFTYDKAFDDFENSWNAAKNAQSPKPSGAGSSAPVSYKQARKDFEDAWAGASPSEYAQARREFEDDWRASRSFEGDWNSGVSYAQARKDFEDAWAGASPSEYAQARKEFEDDWRASRSFEDNWGSPSNPQLTPKPSGAESSAPVSYKQARKDFEDAWAGASPSEYAQARREFEDDWRASRSFEGDWNSGVSYAQARKDFEDAWAGASPSEYAQARKEFEDDWRASRSFEDNWGSPSNPPPAPTLASSIESAMSDAVEEAPRVAPEPPDLYPRHKAPTLAPTLSSSIESAMSEAPVDETSWFAPRNGEIAGETTDDYTSWFAPREESAPINAMEDALATPEPQRTPANLLPEGAPQSAEVAALSAVDDGGGVLPAGADPSVDTRIAAQAEPSVANAAQAASGAVVPGDAAPVGRVAKRGKKQKKAPWWARNEEPVYPKYQNLQEQNREIPAEVEFVAPPGEPFTPAEKAARTEFAATRNAWAVANGEEQTPIPDHFWGSWERDQAEKMNSTSPTSDPSVILDRNNAIAERRWKIQDAANRGAVDEVRELISAPIVSAREQALSNIRNHIRVYGGFPLDFGAAGKFVESEMRSLGDAIGGRIKSAYKGIRDENYLVRDIERKIADGVKWGGASPKQVVEKAHNVVDAIGGYLGKLTDEIVPALSGQDPSAARNLLDESSRELIASSLGVARSAIDGLSKSELQGLRNLVSEPARVRQLGAGPNRGMMRLGDVDVDVATYNRLEAMAQNIVQDLQKVDVLKTEPKQFFQIDNDKLANALGITRTGTIESKYAKPGLHGYETSDLADIARDTGMSPEQLIAAGIATPELRPVNVIIDQEFGKEVVDNLGTYFPEMFGFFESGANRRLQGKTIDEIMTAVDTAGMSAEEVRDLRLLFEQYRDKVGATDAAGRLAPADRTASERFLKNKNLSPAVKKALREITDPGYAAAKAMYQAKHVVEHTKLRRSISEMRDLSLPMGETPQMVNETIRAGGHPHYNSLLDERDWELLPGDKSRYGALAGRYVNRDVSGFMKELYASRDYSKLTKATSAISSMMRSAKTVLNPSSHAHQLLSNAVMLDIMEGVGDPARALKAMVDEAKVLSDKSDPLYKLARDNGVFRGGQFKNDVLEALGNSDVFGDWGKWEEGSVLDSLGPISSAIDAIKGVNAKAGELWEASDNVTRMAAFRRRFAAIKRANQAMPNEEVAALAARSVKDNFLDYSKSSKALRVATGKPIGNTGIDALSWMWMPLGMFGTYSAMMAPKVAKMALGIADNHWMPGTDLGKLMRFWKYPLAIEAAHAMGVKAEGLTDKQAELTRPEWAHSSIPGSYAMLPAKTISGMLPQSLKGLKIFDPSKRYWFDTTAWLPWGDFARAQVDEGGGVRNSKIPNPFAVIPGGEGVAAAIGNPFTKTVAELMENQESFSGRPIYREDASTLYKTRQQADYVYRQMMPNLAPGIPGVTGPMEWSTFANSGGSSASKLISGAYNTAADLTESPHVKDYRGRDRTLPLSLADAVAGAKAFPSSKEDVDRQRRFKYTSQLRDIARSIKQIQKGNDSPAVKKSEIRHLQLRDKAIRAALSKPAPQDAFRFAPTIREQILDKMW